MAQTDRLSLKALQQRSQEQLRLSEMTSPAVMKNISSHLVPVAPLPRMTELKLGNSSLKRNLYLFSFLTFEYSLCSFTPFFQPNFQRAVCELCPRTASPRFSVKVCLINLAWVFFFWDIYRINCQVFLERRVAAPKSLTTIYKINLKKLEIMTMLNIF